MAIVDGRRVLGTTFWKVKGRKDWVMVDTSGRYESQPVVFGTVVKMDTAEDPRTKRFYYCSIVSQPVFLTQICVGAPNYEPLTESSWKKMPEGWRAAFRETLKRYEYID